MRFWLQPATTFANWWEVGNTQAGNKLLERMVFDVGSWPEFFCPLLMPDPHGPMWVWSWRLRGCRHRWRHRRAISLSLHTLSASIISLKWKPSWLYWRLGFLYLQEFHRLVIRIWKIMQERITKSCLEDRISRVHSSAVWFRKFSRVPDMAMAFLNGRCKTTCSFLSYGNHKLQAEQGMKTLQLNSQMRVMLSQQKKTFQLWTGIHSNSTRQKTQGKLTKDWWIRIARTVTLWLTLRSWDFTEQG